MRTEKVSSDNLVSQTPLAAINFSSQTGHNTPREKDIGNTCKTLLVVDDEPQVLSALQRVLRNEPYKVLTAANAGEALACLLRHHVDVILSDYRMPIMNGTQFLTRVMQRNPNTVRLVLSGYADLETISQAINRGVVYNFLAKPWDDDLLRAYLNEAFQHAELIQENHRLKKLEHQDPLTGLPNRRQVINRLEKVLASATKGQCNPAIAIINIDGFKRLNAAFGHEIADGLLVQLSQRLKSTLRSEQCLARIGVDELLLLLPNVASRDELADHMKGILTDVAKPFSINGQELRITSSAGASLYPDGGHTASELMLSADVALRKAKTYGSGQQRLFHPGMDDDASARLLLENDLRKAIEQNELHLVYQPQFDINLGSLCGVESLLRWRHPVLGNISPETFIPIAEETGLINSIGAWVLYTACRATKRWQDAGYGYFKTAVNLSVLQLRDPNLPITLRQILAETGLDARYLELEVTESMLIDDLDAAESILREIKSLGVQLSLDDFGTGYASFGYLNRLPFDSLKIDRSFISSLEDSGEKTPLIGWMIGIAHQLNLKVIAEGVESPEQLAYLHAHGCDTAQGYLLATPRSEKDIVEFLDSAVPHQ